MRFSVARRLAASAGAVVLLATGAPAAMAADPPEIVVQDGFTQPVFGYADAITERVEVVSDVDTDNDGAKDIVSFDIKRPTATEEGLDVPVIMDASPYYTTVCRGNEGECKVRDAEGNLTQWPLFYDNYFVPRGYAMVLLDMIGTGSSTGCPVTGGTADNISAVMAIDWLNGRRAGTYPDGSPAVADWHNGKTGMIGKSYDGTLANAAAATGVEGLTTIVPISAISSWYDYARSQGVILRGNSYNSGLANNVTNPDRRAYCAPVRDAMAAADGDETGDYSPFWAERDYVPNASKVKASVFVVHGTNDDNVMPDHFSKWWYALEKYDVPRKIWLTQTGHIDPFDFRRAEWVAELHKWFDFWLQDVENGIMDEPMADIERAPDVWATYADWPVPGSEDVRLWFRSASDTEGEGAAGGFGFVSEKGPEQRLTFTDTASMSRNAAAANLTTASPNKVVFVSDTLTEDVHVSGTPTVELTASTNQPNTNYGAVLVDLGTDTRVQWTSGDGIRTLGAETETCFGLSTAADNACYLETEKRTVTADREVVTEGIVDGQNLYRRSTATPQVPGQDYTFSFLMQPEDYVFKAGHRFAVVILGSYSGYSSAADPQRATIDLSVKGSRITLPIVGGQAAARAAGV